MVVEGAALHVDPYIIIVVRSNISIPLEVETRSMTSMATLYRHLQHAAVGMDILRSHVIETIVLDEPMAEKSDIWSKSRCGMSCPENRMEYVPYFKIKDEDAYIRGDTHRELCL